MERVKNYKVRDFYKDKRYNPPITSAYMKTKYGQITKGYIDFAKICAQKEIILSQMKKRMNNN